MAFWAIWKPESGEGGRSWHKKEESKSKIRSRQSRELVLEGLAIVTDTYCSAFSTAACGGTEKYWIRTPYSPLLGRCTCGLRRGTPALGIVCLLAGTKGTCKREPVDVHKSQVDVSLPNRVSGTPQ